MTHYLALSGTLPGPLPGAPFEGVTSQSARCKQVRSAVMSSVHQPGGPFLIRGTVTGVGGGDSPENVSSEKRITTD